MKLKTVVVILSVALGATSLPGSPARAKSAAPRAIVAPPGQVKIVTINARQNAVLGIKRFEDMLELVRALRRRPKAFDGGYNGGVTAPDVVVLQEVRTSNLEIFEHILRQRFPHRYQIAGPEEATAQLLYNPDTVTLVGDTLTWPDACLDDQASGRKTQRTYQLAHFTENATGTPFVVVAVHLAKHYEEAEDCRERNVATIRTMVAAESSSVFVAGDFNRRAVTRQFECDIEEQSDPLPWYSLMTEGLEGVGFKDSVRTWHSDRHRSMKGQWTHEQKSKSPTCVGDSLYRRNRIDYIFTRGATIAEAGADNPGWSGGTPGSRAPGTHKYSDHRFVWGRYILAGPPAPTGIVATPAKAGRIDLEWQPTDGATSYKIYRSVKGRDFSQLAIVGAEASSYADGSAEHGVTYRYAVAPIGPGGGQGLESRPKKAKADSKGPKVVGISPHNNATGVSARAVLRVTFSERVKKESVKDDRIRLFRGGKRLDGRVTKVSARVLEFDPTYPMRRGKTHRVKVKPVRDKLGNVGGAFYNWSFTIKPPPRKR